MIKLIGWMAKLTCGVLVTVGLTLYFTWISVQTYVDGFLSRYEIDTPEEKLQFSDFIATMTSSLNIVNQAEKPGGSSGETGAGGGGTEGSRAGAEKRQADGNATATGSSNGIQGAGDEGFPISGQDGIGSDSTTSGGQGQAGAERSPTSGQGQTGGLPAGDGAVPVFGQGAGSAAERNSLVMSADDFFQKKESLSEEDKMAIFSILSGGLPPEELQRLTAIVENGITPEELGSAQESMKKHLKPAQYDRLYAILGKYD